MIKPNVQLYLGVSHPPALLKTLRSGLRKKSKHLVLELIGPGCLMADTALLLYDELMNRPSNMSLSTHASSCLIDGSVLLWLAGEHRTIRSDAWIQMPSYPSSELSSETERSQITSFDESPAETDSRIIAKHIDNYLPLEDVADRRIFVPELQELGLLDDPIEERELLKYLAPKSHSTKSATH